MKDYKRLGDYIREVNVRNRELRVTNLLGLSIEKKFIPSIANTIGTDMSAYKIVQPSQFAYVPVTSRNGEKITVALYDGEESAIISQAYTIFEIVDQDVLLPEYLMMWFRRPEFDRYARFHSHGSAREVFDWDELCNVQLPVPSIVHQREIVAEYETLTRRIRLNEQMIAKLEETAQALYRKMFVDGVDKENLPEGWRKAIVDDVFDFKYGKTLPSELIKEEGEVPVYGANGIIGYYDEANCFDYVGLVTSRGNGSGDVSRTYHKESFVTNNSFVVKAKEQYNYCGFEYVYYLLKSLDFKSICTGSAQPQLTNMSIHLMSFAFPDRKTIMDYCDKAGSLLKGIDVRMMANSELIELQSLLLARMGK